MLKTSCVTLLLILFNSCAWLDSSEEIFLVKDYDVCWHDLESNRTICRKLSCEGCYMPIIDDYVFAVGYDSNYIIAKTHPNFDTSRIDYYIINTQYETKTGSKEVYGPLKRKQFNDISERFEINNLNFSLNFNHIPEDRAH